MINGPTFEHMRSRWRNLADIFREKGVLTKEDMNNLDIPFGGDDGKPKDARAESRGDESHSVRSTISPIQIISSVVPTAAAVESSATTSN